MFQRFKQLGLALTARLTDQDREFLARFLSREERALFATMDIVTQKHALRVAKTCKELAGNLSSGQQELLIKGALLHDLGKQIGDASPLDRVLFVTVNTLFPTLAKKIARAGRGSFIANLRHGFYIHFEHPFLGAQLASNKGIHPLVVRLIREHHFPPRKEDPPELTLLRQADELN